MAKEIKIFVCKTKPFPGSRFVDIVSQAKRLLKDLSKKTKRRPYIRSAYFNKEKVFLSFLWMHIMQKLPSDRARRLKYLPCAIELIKKSKSDPATFEVDKGFIYHRFAGKDFSGRLFYVQIKQNKRTGKKEFISLFPGENE